MFQHFQIIAANEQVLAACIFGLGVVRFVFTYQGFGRQVAKQAGIGFAQPVHFVKFASDVGLQRDFGLEFVYQEMPVCVKTGGKEFFELFELGRVGGNAV
nr:hypothetical protein [Neisseria viridiae]